MKKNISYFLITCVLCSIAFSQNEKNNPEIKFIKGNISDKISSVKDADKEYSSKLSVKAVDFVLENMDILKDDRDLAGLAITAVFAFPESEFNADKQLTVNKFGSIFYGFADKNVRISVLDKMISLSKNSAEPEIIAFVNTYLRGASEEKNDATDVEKKAIQAIAEIGNNESFTILYNCYQTKVWPQFEKDIKTAIISLSDKSTEEIMTIIKDADFAQMKQISELFIENSQISATLKSEIAENLLTNCMIKVRDSSKISKEMSLFQLSCAKILYENKWTRSSALMTSYFEVAKSEFNAGFLTEKEFSDAILYVEYTASKDSVKIFTKYLGELNKEIENGNLPAVNVVSALIKALGALGDKSAFDCLLYTTYLNYPEEIVAQARSALSSLKW
ncbi:hypothetical protein [Treponema sp.]|uniref:hypothetical protein n=1 Tax=Treponema sp. TaxID=166 RepID=UPI00298E15A2|nr:hypothetical protein [Treponema sp.]MCR5612811.1 hypothetical protein [Treponema sp.]